MNIKYSEDIVNSLCNLLKKKLKKKKKKKKREEEEESNCTFGVGFG